MLSLTLLFLLFLSPTTRDGYAYERSRAFHVKVFDKKIKVISPSHNDFNDFEDVHLIVENKSLGKLLGKVNTFYMAIKSNDFQSISLEDLGVERGERFFFVPLSPPFQEVELVLGRRSYEIPPKR